MEIFNRILSWKEIWQVDAGKLDLGFSFISYPNVQCPQYLEKPQVKFFQKIGLNKMPLVFG